MAQPLVEGTVEDDASIVASESSILAGYSGDDNLTGSGLSDQLFGGHTEWREGGFAAGFVGPVMVKVGDNDSIFGGAGDDFIMVGTGTDTIDGGDNYDQINFQFDNQVSFVKLEKVEGSNPPMQRFREFGAVLANVFVDLQTGTYNGGYWSGNTRVGTATGTVINVESVIGSIGNDTINGSSADNAFKPIGGDDTIDGRGGFDILSYNDLAKAGILLDYQKQTVRDGFGGTDRFSNIEIVLGGKNDDTMYGSHRNERFTGNKGADTIKGGGGHDTVDYSWELGTKGIVIDLNTTGVNKDTFGYKDTLKDIDRIIGSKNNDLIEGSHRVDEKFWGREGNDKLYGYGGHDTLYGGIGNDKLDAGGDQDSLYGESGDDTLLGGDDTDTLDGGTGNDRLDGGADIDVLIGGEGDDKLTDNSIDVDDFIRQRRGNTMNGGAGNDTIKGGGVMHGEADNDKIYGMGKLYGDAGDDWIEATSFGNFAAAFPVRLSGGDGRDTLVNATTGGGGYGAADYEYAAVGILIDLHNDTVTVSPTDVDTLVNIRAVYGTGFDDTIFGSEKGEIFIRGGAGNDSLNGNGGLDRILGEEGNDTIIGGEGGDFILDGGDGDDLIFGESDVGTDPLGDDKGSTSIRGGKGNDTIHSGGGNDTIDGGADDDTFYLEVRWAKEVTGGSGRDTFYFGKASTVFAEGGGGADRFILAANVGKITITDFNPANETIDLSAFNVANFKALKKLAHEDSKADMVTFTFAKDVELTLRHTSLDDLDRGDFIL
jgi:Ca2+-binding RTX toxin-like protein